MARLSPVFIVFCISVVGQALTPSSFLTTVDKDRLKRVFESALSLNDLKNTHYSILGFKLLGIKFPKESEACDLFKKTVASSGDGKEGKPDLEAIFHSSRGASLLQSCAGLSPSSVVKALLESILEKSNLDIEHLYYALLSMKNLKLKVDSKKVKTILDAILKKDSSAPVEAYAFHIVPELDLTKAQVKSYFDDIADVVKQADEANKEHLFYDSGLFTTAFVVDGIFKLSAKMGQSPNLPETTLLKFVNYLLSRRHTYQLRAAATLTNALHTLGHNDHQIPVALSVVGSGVMSSRKPSVDIRVSSVWGEPLPVGVQVRVETAKNVNSGATYLNKATLSSSASKDSSGELFSLDMMKSKPVRGFYQLDLSIVPKKADKRLVGLTGRTLGVKVTSEVSFEDVSAEVRDDQATQHKSTLIQHPNRAANTIEVESQQKLTVRYRLSESPASQQSQQVAQAFLLLVHAESKREIAFIAEYGADTGLYRHTVDVGASAKKFQYRSGLYKLHLVIGDPLVTSPQVWHFADADLHFPEAPTIPDTSSTVAATADKPLKGPLPEINHVFRKPDQRAGNTVSFVFTGLCLSPILLLLILWLRIGVNVGNLPLSFSALGFHAGMASIFALYVCYWKYLSMFTTLRYLALLGFPTFIFGNRLLHSIAVKRQKS